jgi:hypothetical protein
MRLPNAERATVEPAKVRDYLLSPEHPVGRAKSRVFTALGFRQAAWTALRDALLAHGQAGEAESAGRSRYGQKYVVHGMLQGPTGRTGPFVSVWLIPTGEEAPRFVTAYPDEET